jgi:hypothetical protein
LSSAGLAVLCYELAVGCDAPLPTADRDILSVCLSHSHFEIVFKIYVENVISIIVVSTKWIPAVASVCIYLIKRSSWITKHDLL